MEPLYPDLHSQLHLLIDGELSSTQSAVVFQALAHDEELRQSYMSSARMSRAAALDAAQMEIPEANLFSIFQKAGVAVSSSASSALSVANYVQTSLKVSAWTRFFPYAITAVLSSVCSLLIAHSIGILLPEPQTTLALVEHNNSPSGIKAIQHSVQATPAQLAPKRRGLIAGSASDTQTDREHRFSSNAASVAAYSHSRPVSTTQAFQPTALQPTVSSSEVQNTQDPYSSRSTPLITIAEFSPVSQQDVSGASAAMPTVQQPRLPELSYADPRISIELRRFAGLGFVNGPDLSPSSLSGAANIGVSFAMKLKGGQVVGVELGQEEVLRAEQAFEQGRLRFASITYAAAFYSFEMDPQLLSSTIKPYAQLTLGATQVGAMMKVATGIHIHVIDNVNLVSGVESTLSQYVYLSKVNCASKTGLFAGIHFNI